MAQTLKLKRSATPAAVPTTGQLDLGEVAINTYDGKMYIKKDDGTPVIVEVTGGSGGGSSPLTTKGDVYTFSTVDARLPVGTNGQVLTADSAEATGLKWSDAAAGGDATLNIGYLNIPQNSQSVSYTAVLADAGKHIFHPSTDANARTFTIPANASVAYPIGTALTFVNMTSQVVTIAITTDTLYLADAGTTGSRSLAQYGTATAVKITATNWLISGVGLT